MTQKPKLEPGQRVRVYQGHAANDGIVIPLKENAPAYPGAVHIEFDAPDYDGNTVREYVHEKQCRKLRPKQKPEKERERVEMTIDVARVGACGSTTFWSPAGGGGVMQATRRSVKLKEIFPGEVVLGREELERAIDQIPLSMDSLERYRQIVEPLCKRFGIGKDKA